MFLKDRSVKMLKRSELINIMKENETKISREHLDLGILKSVLSSIIAKLDSTECMPDSRFSTYGRMEFLKEELNRNLNDKRYLDAYYDISDFLNGSRNSVCMNPEIMNNNIAYYKEDIVCKEEKEQLIEMINTFLKAVN